MINIINESSKGPFEKLQENDVARGKLGVVDIRDILRDENFVTIIEFLGPVGVMEANEK